MRSFRHWFPCLFLLTLPFWMACQNTSAPAKMNAYITQYDSLLSQEEKAVQIQGIFVKHNAMPQFGPSNAYFIPGILLENDSVPRLFIAGEMTVEDMDRLDGKPVTLSGIFSKEERLHPDDPPYASRRRGSWLYDVQDLKLFEQE